MKPRLPILLGVVAGGALAYEAHARRGQQAVERFAAAALETLLNAIEANDADTGMHVRRVAAFALIIADAAGSTNAPSAPSSASRSFTTSARSTKRCSTSCMTPKRLTAAERRAVATHPARGARCSPRSRRSIRSCRPACSRTTSAGTARAIRAGYAADESPSRRASSRSPTPSTPITHARRYRGAAGVGRADRSARGGARNPVRSRARGSRAAAAGDRRDGSQVQITSGGRDQTRRGARRETFPTSASAGARRHLARRVVSCAARDRLSPTLCARGASPLRGPRGRRGIRGGRRGTRRNTCTARSPDTAPPRCSRVPGEAIGPGGRPLCLYVLYGESTSRSL